MNFSLRGHLCIVSSDVVYGQCCGVENLSKYNLHVHVRTCMYVVWYVCTLDLHMYVHVLVRIANASFGHLFCRYIYVRIQKQKTLGIL